MRFWLLPINTIGDQVYQVGEFGSDGVDATVVTGTNSSQAIVTQSLILKMLKSNDECQKSGLEFDDEKHLPKFLVLIK
jgi:hypothetical protein